MNDGQSFAAIAPDARKFSEPIKEGDDIRARINFLSAQNTTIMTQTQFADAKAAALMTVMSLIALRSPFSQAATLTDPLDLATYGLIVASILLCFWAIVPRYPTRKVCEGILTTDKFSWIAISSGRWTAEDHQSFAKDGDLRDLIISLAHSSIGSAKVLREKFLALRWAFVSGIGAVILMTVRYLPE